MADNLRQVSNWTLKGFHKEQTNIELFLKLIRKDLNALLRFPLPRAFMPTFKKFCTVYDELEAQYHAGLEDHRTWANGIQNCAQDLKKQSLLV